MVYLGPPLPSSSFVADLLFSIAELGRPQIHGYPLASVAFTSRVQFVSGADEKIVRVFDAPKVFVSSARKLSGVELGDEVSD